MLQCVYNSVYTHSAIVLLLQGKIGDTSFFYLSYMYRTYTSDLKEVSKLHISMSKIESYPGGFMPSSLGLLTELRTDTPFTLLFIIFTLNFAIYTGLGSTINLSDRYALDFLYHPCDCVIAGSLTNQQRASGHVIVCALVHGRIPCYVSSLSIRTKFSEMSGLI